MSWRKEFPLRVRIIATNPFGLPVGRIFLWARRDGDPAYPIEVRTTWPGLQTALIYSLTDQEAEVLPPKRKPEEFHE